MQCRRVWQWELSAVEPAFTGINFDNPAEGPLAVPAPLAAANRDRWVVLTHVLPQHLPSRQRQDLLLE